MIDNRSELTRHTDDGLVGAVAILAVAAGLVLATLAWLVWVLV